MEPMALGSPPSPTNTYLPSFLMGDSASAVNQSLHMISPSHNKSPIYRNSAGGHLPDGTSGGMPGLSAGNYPECRTYRQKLFKEAGGSPYNSFGTASMEKGPPKQGLFDTLDASKKPKSPMLSSTMQPSADCSDFAPNESFSRIINQSLNASQLANNQFQGHLGQNSQGQINHSQNNHNNQALNNQALNNQSLNNQAMNNQAGNSQNQFAGSPFSNQFPQGQFAGSPRFSTSPQMTNAHLTSAHLTSAHLTSPHLASPHLTSSQLTNSQLTSSQLTSPQIANSPFANLQMKNPNSQQMSSQQMSSQLQNSHLSSSHLLNSQQYSNTDAYVLNSMNESYSGPSQIRARSKATCWVTIFGFPPSQASIALSHFTNCGHIVDKKFPTQGNYVHIKFNSPYEVNKALGFNGRVIMNNIMVGVMPHYPDDNKENGEIGSDLTSPIRARSLRHSYVSPVGPSSLNNSLSVPQKSTGIVTKAMEYVFGW